VCNVRTSLMVGVASSVANDVIMGIGAASAASVVGGRRHENDVTMTTAGLWRYGDWRHVATGCTALVIIIKTVRILQTCEKLCDDSRVHAENSQLQTIGVSFTA